MVAGTLGIRLYPGVDVLLGTPTHIVGLPRTTRIVNAVAEPQPQEA